MTVFLFFACNKNEQPQESITDTALEVREGCPDPAFDPSCTYYTVSNVLINYQNCPILVSYKVKRCLNKVYIYDFSITWSSVKSCAILQNQWLSLLQQNKLTQLYASYNTFYQYLTNQVELIEINKLVDENKLPPCSGTDNVATLDWLETGCKQLCGDFSDPNLPFVYENKCGDGCCQRRTDYCLNANGTIHKGSPIITSLFQCTPALGTFNCNTPCKPACDRL